MYDNKVMNNLPSIEKCKRIFKSISILDAIIMPEWEYRYYSFNSKWDTGEMMASMRDGSGEHYFALFNNYGLIIKGFEQTGQIDSKIFKNVPIEFKEFLKEPAFIIDETNFVVWSLSSEKGWNSGKEHSSDELYLLSIIIEGAEGYAKWAKEYYETNIDLDTVKDIFNFKPLNQDMVNSLNDELLLDDILEDIVEIDYPVENK